MTFCLASCSDDNYARIKLDRKRLGGESLPITCSAYPRVMNLVDDVVQRFVGPVVPEAASIALLRAGARTQGGAVWLG
jgi:hypothetical protein